MQLPAPQPPAAACPTMPPELTLIVAATRTMGIGAHGTLPWTGLRKEMLYFARVTTRLPPQAPAGAVNAVIMGRRTWESIPPSFRPLKGRLNIVVTRSADAVAATVTATATATAIATPSASASSSAAASSSASASGLSASAAAAASSSTPPASSSSTTQLARVASLDHALQYIQAHGPVARIFVIGGAQIYRAALDLPATRRVLLTSITSDFDCDTFFPLDLSGGNADGWRRTSRDELQRWTGETVDEAGQEEAGIRYEFQMWEKVDM